MNVLIRVEEKKEIGDAYILQLRSSVAIIYLHYYKRTVKSVAIFGVLFFIGLTGFAKIGQGFWHCAGSSDGKWVVGDTFKGALNLINLTTGEVKLLTEGHYAQGTNIHSHHTFSADGKGVLFNSDKLGNPDIMILAIFKS